MATSTEVAIATTTLSSAASSITFSSIPSTYTDLRVVVVGKAPSGNAIDPRLNVNSDTGTNYSRTGLRGDGTTATSGRSTGDDKFATGYGNIPASGVGLYTFDIFSYAGSTYKTMMLVGNADANGSGYINTAVGLWRSTAAINSVTVGFLNNADVGTTATLYGIL